MSFRAGQAKGPSVRTGSGGGTSDTTTNAGNSSLWTYKGYDNTSVDPFGTVLASGEFFLWTPIGAPSTTVYAIFNEVDKDGINLSLFFDNVTNTSVVNIQDSVNNALKISIPSDDGNDLGNGTYIFTLSTTQSEVYFDTFTAGAVLDSTSVVLFDVRDFDTNSPTSPAGSNTQMQFNDNGSFGGVPNLRHGAGGSTPSGDVATTAESGFIQNLTTHATSSANFLDVLLWTLPRVIIVDENLLIQNAVVDSGTNGKSIVATGNNIVTFQLSIEFDGNNTCYYYGKVNFNAITGATIDLAHDVYIQSMGGAQANINFTGAGTLYYEGFDGGDAPVGWTGNIVKQSWTNLKPAPSSDANNAFTYGSDGLPYVDNSGGGGAVTSVFGRIGAVIAQANDYIANLIGFSPSGYITSTNVQGAIDQVRSKTDANEILANSKVASVSAGTNVTITGTPTNPIINASGGGGPSALSGVIQFGKSKNLAGNTPLQPSTYEDSTGAPSDWNVFPMGIPFFTSGNKIEALQFLCGSRALPVGISSLNILIYAFPTNSPFGWSVGFPGALLHTFTYSQSVGPDPSSAFYGGSAQVGLNIAIPQNTCLIVQVDTLPLGTSYTDCIFSIIISQ